jgi:DNA primase catalytic core
MLQGLGGYQDLKSAATIDAMIRYVETLLGIRFTRVRKNRYNALCPFHADTQDRFMAYVNKDDEVRFHCFGACKGDWDIYDLIMLRKHYRFRKAQQAWAVHMGATDFKFDDGSSPGIPEPDETPEPDEPVGIAEPKERDEKMVSALNDAATFYNDLLMSNEDRSKPIWNYLSRRGVGKETISRFTIGYAPSYSDEQHHGRALIDSFWPRFEKDADVFDALLNGGLFRFLNDATVKGYGYYCRQIDFKRKNLFSRNYGDFFAGRLVFPIYDADACPIGLVGRRPDDRGVRWLKHQSREVPLSARSWLYGLHKAKGNIRQYRTIILVEGIFDYFTFYNLLHDQGKAVVVSTLGSYITPEAAAILKDFDIEHYIVAYDWDELGRNGIERLADKTGGWVYYLGGLAEGQDAYSMLKPVVKAISGFSLKHGPADAQ